MSEDDKAPWVEKSRKEREIAAKEMEAYLATKDNIAPQDTTANAAETAAAAVAGDGATEGTASGTAVVSARVGSPGGVVTTDTAAEAEIAAPGPGWLEDAAKAVASGQQNYESDAAEAAPEDAATREQLQQGHKPPREPEELD